MPPKQYQQGWVEFYKLRFKITPAVLIPRPESELLVDEVLSLVNGGSLNHQPYTIIDVGTGCGNIAISLAKYLPTWNVGTRIIATDISEKALKVAKQNAKFHQIKNQILFVHADLLEPIIAKNSACHLEGGNVNLGMKSDLIVANLPYIPSERIPYLDRSVKDYEPVVALDGGPDGFELYRKLLSQISNFSLTTPSWKPKYLVGEIDYTHGELASQETLKYFPKAEVEVKKDFARLQRILVVRFSEG